jgi:hypothetical protein
MFLPLHSHKELDHLITSSQILHFLWRNVVLLHCHILPRRLDTLKHHVVVRQYMYSEVTVVVCLALLVGEHGRGYCGQTVTTLLMRQKCVLLSYSTLPLLHMPIYVHMYIRVHVHLCIHVYEKSCQTHICVHIPVHVHVQAQYGQLYDTSCTHTLNLYA